MKFTPEVIAALSTLREHADNDFERHRLDVLERDLTAPPRVEVVDDTHQRFNGIVFHRDNQGHYVTSSTGIHRFVWQYYVGDIPEGYEIHHVDENKSNNTIDNFSCLTKAEHRAVHNAQMHVTKEYRCDFCGKSFATTSINDVTHRFCSDNCRLLYHRNNLSVACAVCGKFFTTSKSKPASCCSKSCAQKWRHQNKRRPADDKVCPYCHSKFSTSNANKTYCSKDCATKAYRESHSQEKICSICGKHFSTGKYSDTKCCSSTCAHKMRWQTRRVNT